jgi:dinuclear metal center YbgI/SA1388 family protein
MGFPRVSDVVAALDALYDPATAESWDAVGLVCGDPEAEVRRILLAVDPVEATVDEALAWEADLMLVHHPLLLRAVHGVPATTAKGRLVHRLITNGCALLVAHTNADRAAPGVSDALARAIGLVGDLQPLTDDGLGRVGELPEVMRLDAFAATVAAALPVGPDGVRVAGDPSRSVRLVAVAGGAGDDLFDAVRASSADVYVTADLRHHPVSEAMETGGPALIDAGHFATEWPWLADAQARLAAALGADSVETRVSTLCTDPWTFLERGSR